MSKHLVTILIVLAIVIGGTLFWKSALAPTVQNQNTKSTKTYVNSELHYAISYPADFSLNTSFSYTGLGPGEDRPGVSFTIPKSMSDGTNLSSDSYVSVESVATTSCAARVFLGDAQGSSQKNTNRGVTYDFLKGVGAGAGNLYEEYVYAFSGSNPCIAIRYFIHSGNIGNYPPGMVTEFDKAALLSTFDTIRHSFVKL